MDLSYQEVVEPLNLAFIRFSLNCVPLDCICIVILGVSGQSDVCLKLIFEILTCRHSDIDGVGISILGDAGPRAVVPVKVSILDANVAVVLQRVAQVSYFVIIGAVTFIVVATFFLECGWDLKLSSRFGRFCAHYLELL